MATNNEITNLFKIKDLPIDKTAGTKLDCHEAYVGIHMQEQRFYEVHVEAFMGYGACGAGAFVYETPVRQIDTAEVLELARTYASERYQEIEARVKSVERAYTVPHIASDTKENDSCGDCRGGKMTQDSSPASGNRLRKRNIAWIAGKVTDGTNVQNLCATYISRNHSIKYYVPTNANNKTQGIEPSFISLPDELETMAELIAYLKAYYPVLVPKHYQDDSTEAVRYYRPHSADMTIVSFNLFTGHYYFECTPEEISIFRNNQTHLHSVTLEKRYRSLHCSGVYWPLYWKKRGLCSGKAPMQR